VFALGCQREIRFDDPLPPADAPAPPPSDDAGARDDASPVDAPSAADRAIDLPPDRVADSTAADRAVDVAAPDVAPADAAPRDAAADRSLDSRPDMAPVVCQGLCTPWSPQCPTGAGCDSDCDNGDTCNGTCGSSCAARCRGNSDCTVTAGTAADLECREGSSCSFVLTSGSIRCRESADCTIRCLGPCTVDCEGSRCSLQCATDSAPHTVGDDGRCN
jgi:hypothetical protein